MKHELKTMEEKMKLNPNEMMENGLTREQNEKIETTSGIVSLIGGLVAIGLSIYSLHLIFSI
jgi:hypothetical protein